MYGSPFDFLQTFKNVKTILSLQATQTQVVDCIWPMGNGLSMLILG